jgi:hypothetical protein
MQGTGPALPWGPRCGCLCQKTSAPEAEGQDGTAGRVASAAEAPTRAGASATRPRHSPPPTYGLPGAPPLSTPPGGPASLTPPGGAAGAHGLPHSTSGGRRRREGSAGAGRPGGGRWGRLGREHKPWFVAQVASGPRRWGLRRRACVTSRARIYGSQTVACGKTGPAPSGAGAERPLYGAYSQPSDRVAWSDPPRSLSGMDDRTTHP